MKVYVVFKYLRDEGRVLFDIYAKKGAANQAAEKYQKEETPSKNGRGEFFVEEHELIE